MACSSAIGTKPIFVFKSSAYVNLMLPVRDKRAIVRAKMLTIVTMPAVISPIFFFVSAFIISPVRRAFREYHRTIVTIARINSTDMASIVVGTAYPREQSIFSDILSFSHSLFVKHDANFRCAELNTIQLRHRCNLPMFFS